MTDSDWIYGIIFFTGLGLFMLAALLWLCRSTRSIRPGVISDDSEYIRLNESNNGAGPMPSDAVLDMRHERNGVGFFEWALPSDVRPAETWIDATNELGTPRKIVMHRYVEARLSAGLDLVDWQDIGLSKYLPQRTGLFFMGLPIEIDNTQPGITTIRNVVIASIAKHGKQS